MGKIDIGYYIDFAQRESDPKVLSKEMLTLCQKLVDTTLAMKASEITNDSDIKPCPFCGGTELNTSYVNSIHCMDVNCGGNIDMGVYGVTRALTIEAWNKRTPC